MSINVVTCKVIKLFMSGLIELIFKKNVLSRAPRSVVFNAAI